MAELLEAWRQVIDESIATVESIKQRIYKDETIIGHSSLTPSWPIGSPLASSWPIVDALNFAQDVMKIQRENTMTDPIGMSDIEKPALPTNHFDPQSEPILQFFRYDHLPEHLQDVSRSFSILAAALVESLPRNPERTVTLRKLLESKDAAVRARLFK